MLDWMMDMAITQKECPNSDGLEQMARQVEENLYKVERAWADLPNVKGPVYEVARRRLVRWLDVFNLQPNKVA